MALTIAHIQMEKAVILTISFFLLIFYCSASLVSSVNTLRPGDSLSSPSTLYSPSGLFALGFYKPKDLGDSYLGIWAGTDYIVWVGNRENGISDDSGILTLNSAGKLIITCKASYPTVLYAGGDGKNVTATLLDSGNFVVREMNINGSEGRILWESFDYPTDTLIPGMKLGVNHRTGRNWHLTSWFGENNPASGAFTLEWDPVTRRLIVRRRELAYWTSGDLKDYTNQSLRLNVKEFENIVPKPDFESLNYNFTSVSNSVEDYFSYSLIIKDPVPFLDLQKTISGWRLRYNGDIYDTGRPMIAGVSLCYGYNIQMIQGSSVYKGCELWEQPSCKNHNETFVFKSGNFRNSDGSEPIAESPDDLNLTESDCRENCWKDCECLGFVIDETGYGCKYWKGKNLTFLQTYDGPKNSLLF